MPTSKPSERIRELAYASPLKKELEQSRSQALDEAIEMIKKKECVYLDHAEQCIKDVCEICMMFGAEERMKTSIITALRSLKGEGG